MKRICAALVASALLFAALPLAGETPSGTASAGAVSDGAASDGAAKPAASGKTGDSAAPASGLFSSWPGNISGDYVVYLDKSWEKPTWVGFLYYDDLTWGAFAITPATGSNVSLLFTAETFEGEMVLTGQNIISKISPDDVLAVNYLMKMLPNCYGWRHDGKGDARAVSTGRSELLPASVRQSRNIPLFGGDITLEFAPEVPLFNLKGINDAAGKPVFELVRSGRVGSLGDSEFFNFKPMGEAKAGTVLSVPASRKTEAKKVDGVTLNLDDQWTMVADNTFFLGNAAVLIVDSLDLSLMEIPRGNLPLSLVRMFSLSNAESWAVPSALTVSGTAKKFTITNLFYDSVRGVLNRDVKTCMLSADGKTCVVVSLSASETAWKANAAYFESLVE